MKVRVVNVTTTPQNIFDLMSQSQQQVSGIKIESKENNNKNIFYGDRSFQAFTLGPGDSDILPIVDTTSLWVVSAQGTQVLVIGLL